MQPIITDDSGNLCFEANGIIRDHIKLHGLVKEYSIEEYRQVLQLKGIRIQDYKNYTSEPIQPTTWIPIHTLLPDKGMTVLIFTNNEIHMAIFDEHFMSIDDQEYFGEVEDVTHWKYLETPNGDIY